MLQYLLSLCEEPERLTLSMVIPFTQQIFESLLCLGTGVMDGHSPCLHPAYSLVRGEGWGQTLNKPQNDHFTHLSLFNLHLHLRVWTLVFLSVMSGPERTVSSFLIIAFP